MHARRALPFLGAAAAVAAFCTTTASAAGRDSAANLRKQKERRAEYSNRAYQARLRRESDAAFQAALATLRSDPERNFVTDACWSKAAVLSVCLGDIRLYDWGPKGYGFVEPVLFTNRSGATISGHVFATLAGSTRRRARRRPGVVITSGSLQATEQMYWWAAQTLAKAGYVVLTTDPQNQGLSDTFGEGLDRLEGATSQADGNTFYDGTQDALDFLLSTPDRPYCARPSRSGLDHCAKQLRRVRAGLNAAFNPFWRRVDPERIGLAGHSGGAHGISYFAHRDGRVDAGVAWDNLCMPEDCIRRPPGDAPHARVPMLGITQDYLTHALPQPLSRSSASHELSALGIDTGQLFIRGGTHWEYAYLPNRAFPATRRGMHFAAWYTVAWFDKYVKGDPAADRRLLSTRWRNDPGDARIDPAGGGNLFSSVEAHKSRLDIGLAAGGRFLCTDLRKGCSGQFEDDGEYSFLDIVTTRDRPRPRLTARTVPRRDHRRPFRFVTRGELQRPAAVDRQAGCRGRVQVQYTPAGRAPRARLARLGGRCRYRTSVRFRRRGPIRVAVRFGGNPALRPAQARTRRIAAGGRPAAPRGPLSRAP